MPTGMKTKISRKSFLFYWKIKSKTSITKIKKSVQESDVSNSPNWERGDLTVERGNL